MIKKQKECRVSKEEGFPPRHPTLDSRSSRISDFFLFSRSYVLAAKVVQDLRSFLNHSLDDLFSRPRALLFGK
jgi:hypothetical protein